MQITSDIIYGFVGSVLSSRFDEPAPTPSCHREWWNLCCSNSPFVAIAAPRGHGKSTAITKSYILSSVLFRDRKFCLVISDTYKQACLFLGEIKTELLTNQVLRELFKVDEFEVEREDDIIVRFKDGQKFRIMALGSEQKVRGALWDGKRPDLIVCDDLENDEIVLSQDRREKFRKWFNEALIPCKNERGVIRVIGTILHMDSLLERLMPADYAKDTIREPLKTYSKDLTGAWKACKYQAHDEKYEHLLWPEKWNIKRLQAEQQRFIKDGNPEGYYQEYLNRPIDPTHSFFKKDDFISEQEEDKKKTHKDFSYYIGTDLAVSLEQRTDFCAFVCGGLDSEFILHIKHVVRKRMDSEEIIETIFSLNRRFPNAIFTFEKGLIEKSILPFLRSEMLKRNVFLNIELMTAHSDKRVRARGIQARMRTGTVKFDKSKDWYPEFEQEMLRFDRDIHDDQVDAISWLGITIDKQVEALSPKEQNREEWEEEKQKAEYYDLDKGKSVICGY